jgi:ABC-type antimicrobial peptide transport system permease subunit
LPPAVILLGIGVFVDHIGHLANVGRQLEINEILLIAAIRDVFSQDVELAFSLLALFVGVFLIYNTAMFAVVSRRRDTGILRSLGARRYELVAAFLTEILILGAIGGSLGGLLGYFLTQFLT